MRTQCWRRWLKQNLDQVLAYSKFIISSSDCQQIITTIVTIAVTIKDDKHDSIKAITTVNSADGYFRHRCLQQLLWFLPSPIFKRESSIWRWLVLVYSHPLCSALFLSNIRNVFWLVQQLICKFSQIDILFDKSLQVRPDDVWIITPPKCGTTWTQVLNND